MKGRTLKGMILQVNHSTLGTLFAAMIQGAGELITEQDEEGNDLPFLSTEQILEQIAKFGFYVKYDVKSNLPGETISFLATIDNLGYDKITRVLLQEVNKEGEVLWKPNIIIFNSAKDNSDLLTYGTRLTRAKYVDKVNNGSVMNVTHEKYSWDWVTSMFNICDILDENIDPVDEYKADADIACGNIIDTFHPYDEEDDDPTDDGIYGSEPVDDSQFTVYEGSDADE